VCYPNLRKKENKFDFFLIAFYLILDVAVGGTNGWFPDGAGNKPWLNGALGVFLPSSLQLGGVVLWLITNVYVCRRYANFRASTGQVVQDMARE